MTILGIDLKKQAYVLITELFNIINNNDQEKFKTFSSEGMDVDVVFKEIKVLINDYCSKFGEPPINIQLAPIDLFLEEYNPTGDNLIQFYFIEGNEDKDDILENEWQYSDGEWNIECRIFVNGKETGVILETDLFYSDDKLKLQYRIIHPA